jgi:hypothetical protein
MDQTLTRADVIEVSYLPLQLRLYVIGTTYGEPCLPFTRQDEELVGHLFSLAYDLIHLLFSACCIINATNKWHYKSSPVLLGEKGTRLLIKATGQGVRWVCHTVQDLWAGVLGHATTMPLIRMIIWSCNPGHRWSIDVIIMVYGNVIIRPGQWTGSMRAGYRSVTILSSQLH